MKINIILLWIVVLLFGSWLVYKSVQTNQQFGSVTVGNEYTATTTPVNGSWSDMTIRQGNGALGSVIVTGAGNAEIVLYDATSTTDVTRKQLVHLPASLAAGTYTFDVSYINGLVMDVVTGTTGTSTITYR